MKSFKLFASILLLLVAATSVAQEKKIAIIGVNDMHACIEQMPVLADVVDSVRAIYPNLLVLSAGDNRTGNPLNDQYKVASYPMTMLMNAVGINASAFGNHEFDGKLTGLATNINKSHFRYLCANMDEPEKHGLNIMPYQYFDVGGVRVGVLGIVQLGVNGLPDSHPDNLRGVKFFNEKETIEKYQWLRDKCDVEVLLSHCGYEADKEFAQLFPHYDIIVGGHSHDKVEGEMHNGVLVTQTQNRLQYATLAVLTVDNGKVTHKEAKLIDLHAHQGRDEAVENMVKFFSDNPSFQRVLTTASDHFTSYEELGCMMTEALRSETNADVCVWNAGGVRYDNLLKGPITVSDILRLDPFGNLTMTFTLTGAELKQMIIDCRHGDEDRAPYVAGMTYEIVIDKANPKHVKDVRMTLANGKKVAMKTKYKVATNSYVPAISLKNKTADTTLDPSSTVLMNWLEKQPSVNFRGKTCVKETMQ